MKRSAALAIVSMTIFSMAAAASETVKYTYDARGRLVKVVRTGTVTDVVTTDYTLDKADNRLRVKTTGASN